MSAIPTAVVLGFAEGVTEEEIEAQAKTWREMTKEWGLADDVTFTVEGKRRKMIVIRSDNPARLLAIAKAMKEAGANYRVIHEGALN